MGKAWDCSGVAFDVETWRAALRVLKPGGHLLAFGGSRTSHRMAVAIEDAGFEIRDTIMWIYGSGFPKSHDVSKAIDKSLGATREAIVIAGRSGSSRACMNGHFTGGEYHLTAPATDAALQWEGWGTALKPAHEPIILARKPFRGTVAANVLRFGTGAINIDGCRVPGEPWKAHSASGLGRVKFFSEGETPVIEKEPHDLGRWPANVCHDGLAEGWSHYFYCAKASKADRGDGNSHPTVKPTSLMRYLVRLVTPPSGVILDPFMGSGSTGKAALLEGFDFIGFELDEGHYAIAEKRIESAMVVEPQLAS